QIINWRAQELRARIESKAQQPKGHAHQPRSLGDGDRMRGEDGDEKKTADNAVLGNAIRNLHRPHIRMTAVHYSISKEISMRSILLILLLSIAVSAQT